MVLISLSIAGFVDVFLDLDKDSVANYKQTIISEIITNNEWIKLDSEVSFIEAEFLDSQQSAYLETENSRLPIKLAKYEYDGHHQDELRSEDNNFSRYEVITPSRWIKVQSDGRVKVTGWNEYKSNTLLKPIKDLFASLTSSVSGINIISRSSWGADEGLRYDYSSSNNGSKKTATNVKSNEGGNKACIEKIKRFPSEYVYKKVVYNDNNGAILRWPYQYSPSIKKIVVHHTAESEKASNLSGQERMKSVYRYHTMTKRWGDIGYHYVIDDKGKIFEGRAGGDYVVGGHAFCSNIGTIGISLMGNFQNIKPTGLQLRSLSKLIAYLGNKYNINVIESSVYHGVLSDNILGHRDLKSTACPGDNMYSRLGSIRKQIELADYNFNLTETVSYQYDDSAKVTSNLGIIEMDPTSSKFITISYKNVGSETWKKGTWLYVADNNNRSLYVESLFGDKNYVAADLEEDIVRPGEVGNFTVEIVSGFDQGLYSLEFTPIINGSKKLDKGTVIQPVKILASENSYTFLQLSPPPSEIYYGQSLTAKIKFENTGNTTWQRSGDNAITLKAYPLGKESDFIPRIGDNDPTVMARLVEPKVHPGETGTFEFIMKAPLRQGAYEEKFIPVIGKDSSIGDRSMQFNIKVKKPSYKAQLLRESTKNEFFVGEKKTVRLGLKNISDVPWDKEQVSFRVIKSGGLKFDLSSYEIADFVPIHQAGFTNVTIQAPSKAGKYSATLQALADGKKFDRLGRFELEIEVVKPKLNGILTHLSSDSIYIPQGKEDSITVRIKNKTSMTWYRHGKNRISARTYNKNSPLKSSKWITNTMASYMEESKVRPGQTATFKISLHPKEAGNFTESFYFRLNSIGNIEGTDFSINVSSGESEVMYTNPAKSQETKPTFEYSPPSQSEPIIKSEYKIPENLSLKERIMYLRQKHKVNSEPDETHGNKQNVVIKHKPSTNNNISVKLSFPHHASNIGSIGNMSIHLDDKSLDFNKHSQIWVRSDGDYRIIVNIDGILYWGSKFTARASDNNSFIRINNWNHSPGWNKDLNDNYYRGEISIIAADSEIKGNIHVINTLNFGHYLKGIAEVPESSHHEKRKAISVIARSYAMHYTKTKYRKFPNKSYDASDDPNIFQKYLGAGYEARSPLWQQALEDTRGEILEYNGEILRSAYFSCSDGRTRTPLEAKWSGSEYFSKVSEVYQAVNDEYGKDLSRYNKGQCGHGVGLSGLGAEKLAYNGSSYKMILHYYYQNIDIVKKY